MSSLLVLFVLDFFSMLGLFYIEKIYNIYDGYNNRRQGTEFFDNTKGPYRTQSWK